MGNDADQKEKYGEKVTYLKAASDKIAEALKLVKVRVTCIMFTKIYCCAL